MPFITKSRPRKFWLNKIDLFFHAEDSSEGIAKALGLDLREVMTTVTRTDPAFTYHSSFGLVLDGEIKACFDYDTGKLLLENGEYNDHLFSFTHQTTPEELAGRWYEERKTWEAFTWNEAILAKGSRVTGAFYDPRCSTDSISPLMSENKIIEFKKFLDKVNRAKLPLLEIRAKYLP